MIQKVLFLIKETYPKYSVRHKHKEGAVVFMFRQAETRKESTGVIYLRYNKEKVVNSTNISNMNCQNVFRLFLYCFIHFENTQK